jgi:hypothetical protein
MEQHFVHSSFREKLIEHLFVSELLKLAWAHKDFSLEVSKPEVDNSGYDLIVEYCGVIRHIQIKTSYKGARAASQKVHQSLSKKPSGCVVWIYFDAESMELGPFLFFGGKPGDPLPAISNLKTAKHTKGNAQGVKAERPNLKVIPKSKFQILNSIQILFTELFGQTID